MNTFGVVGLPQQSMPKGFQVEVTHICVCREGFCFDPCLHCVAPLMYKCSCLLRQCAVSTVTPAQTHSLMCSCTSPRHALPMRHISQSATLYCSLVYWGTFHWCLNRVQPCLLTLSTEAHFTDVLTECSLVYWGTFHWCLNWVQPCLLRHISLMS